MHLTSKRGGGLLRRAKNPKLMQGNPAKLGKRAAEVVDDTGMGKGFLKSREWEGNVREQKTDFPYDTTGALRVILGPGAMARWKLKQVRSCVAWCMTC
jgi:hypothetical protein